SQIPYRTYKELHMILSDRVRPASRPAFKTVIIAALAADLLLPIAVNAVESAEAGPPEPLWELGFGAGALHAPDYPGSSEKHLRGLALPYVVYRGDIFRLGDGQTAR